MLCRLLNSHQGDCAELRGLVAAHFATCYSNSLIMVLPGVIGGEAQSVHEGASTQKVSAESSLGLAMRLCCGVSIIRSNETTQVGACKRISARSVSVLLVEPSASLVVCLCTANWSELLGGGWRSSRPNLRLQEMRVHRAGTALSHAVLTAISHCPPPSALRDTI